MKQFIQEFKTFALRGNVMDMAVGVIIGGAFGKIVSSVVGDIIMPPLNFLLSGTDTGNSKWVLRNAAEEVVDAAGNIVTPAVTEISINYGAFIQNCIDFIIIAFIIFLMVKGISKLANLRKKEEEEEAKAPAAPSREEVLLTEIRDLLKEQKK